MFLLLPNDLSLIICVLLGVVLCGGSKSLRGGGEGRGGTSSIVQKYSVFKVLMHQSFVTTAPPPMGKGRDYDFSAFSALL